MSIGKRCTTPFPRSSASSSPYHTPAPTHTYGLIVITPPTITTTTTTLNSPPPGRKPNVSSWKIGLVSSS